MFNVLVFPGGTEIGLEIHRSLCQCKDVYLHSAGLDISNHASYVFARHFTIPSIYGSDWIAELNRVIDKARIDYIFPAYDDVIVALAQNAEKIQAQIVSSPLDTCLVTRSKLSTYRLFEGTVPVPIVYDEVEAIDQYPVFVKPDRGQGSQGTYLAHSYEKLVDFLGDCRDTYVISEYLPGDEYTVDCFSDREKGLLFCSGRKRNRTKNGISMDSYAFHDEKFKEFADSITTKLKFYGAWFYQVKQDRAGAYKLMEIAPRIAGTMAFHRVQGVNFPLLSLYEQERIPIDILLNSINVHIDRALINRYRHSIHYSKVYVDLDDTLIINDEINVELIRFLYQCINRKIGITLITKHVLDISRTLKKYRLEGIFDDVIHIGKFEEKADHISERDAIFIDDSFSERKAVNDQCGILTFDCSMLELLIDDRR